MMIQITVEGPHGVLLFVNAIDASFYGKVYKYINLPMVLSSAVSKVANIIIYYALSKAFRDTVKNKVLKWFRGQV